MSLQHEIPARLAMELQPEDLARPLLKWLVKLEGSGAKLHRGNFRGDCAREYGHAQAVENRLLESWALLEREGLLTRTHDDFYVVSDRGRERATLDAQDPLHVSGLLPKAILHPRLADGAYRAFLRGEYPQAVRDAFGEVEIAVRSAALLRDDVTGFKVMSEAFNLEQGRLTDRDLPISEQEGMQLVFMGASKLFRNPPSHRRVAYTPVEAAQLLVFASHLLAMADARQARADAHPPQQQTAKPRAAAKNDAPPGVSIAADVSLDRAEFPHDRYAAGWGRSRNLRYTVIEIRNLRREPITLAGVKLEFEGLGHPVWIIATNSYRELAPNEQTHAYFETTKYPSMIPSRVTVRWVGGEHTYESFPQLEGWTDPPSLPH